MNFILITLLLIAVAFVVYAVFTQWNGTVGDFRGRFVAAMTAAAAALGAAIAHWLHSATAP